MNSKKIVFLTISNPGYSRSWTYFNGARKLGANVEFVKIESKKLTKQFLELKKIFSSDLVFVVMSPSHYLVPFVKIFLGRTVILDAGWSLFEATVIARKKFGFLGLLAVKTYLIDFVSSHIATKVVVESKNQANYYSRIFLISRKKIEVMYTGVDEQSFKNSYHKVLLPNYFNNSKIVLFRGKYNKEAGIEILAAATRLLAQEEFTFWIFSPGLPSYIKFSKNSYVSRKFVRDRSMIASLYNHSQITIGQMSSNSRLIRTIPHKAFESAYLSKPYITAGNLGIREIFMVDKEIICTKADDPIDLAQKIKYFLNNPKEASKIGKSMNLRYGKLYSQKILASKFIELVLDLS
jgi:glycosyltransferase involved in cell wall biosynthesis